MTVCYPLPTDQTRNKKLKIYLSSVPTLGRNILNTMLDKQNNNDFVKKNKKKTHILQMGNEMLICLWDYFSYKTQLYHRNNSFKEHLWLLHKCS